MGTMLGMRGKDLQKFLMVARDHQVILLVRHTNEDSLRYVGRPGYYPKPAVVKAKTADLDPPSTLVPVNGRMLAANHQVSGLVVHPGFQPMCYRGAKVKKAQECWDQTMDTLAPAMKGKAVDLTKPATWAEWGKERLGVNAPRWHWKVDVDLGSPHFGAIQLKGPNGVWCYVHGDYDLKDVIVLGRETENQRHEGTIDGVKNYTPMLYQKTFERILADLNAKMGVDMVQHGAEAQFAWHGDEPITVAFPDWSHVILTDAVTVQGWYQSLNRQVLAKMGHDYQRDRSRMWHFGPEGIFAPGALPADSWGS